MTENLDRQANYIIVCKLKQSLLYIFCFTSSYLKINLQLISNNDHSLSKHSIQFTLLTADTLLCRSVLPDVSGRPGLHSSWRSYDSYNQLTRKLSRYLCVCVFLKGYFTQKWKICHHLHFKTLISFLDELSLQCLVVYVCFCACLVLCLSSDVSCSFTPVLCTYFLLCNAWKQPQTSLSIWPTYAETHTQQPASQFGETSVAGPV